MSLSNPAIADEIYLSEGQKYQVLYDGVYLDESIYKDYVFKALRYEYLSDDFDKINDKFKDYRDNAEDQCGILTKHGSWFMFSLFLSGTMIGLRLNREK